MHSEFKLENALRKWEFKKAFKLIEKLQKQDSYRELLENQKRDLSEFLEDQKIDFEKVQSLERLSSHYFLARIVEHFLERKSLPNDILRLTHLLYLQECEGANVYLAKLISLAKACRIAILVCGALRGDYKKAFLDLQEKARILGADLFVFSWDKASEWIGASGNGIGFLRGFFDERVLQKAPQGIISANTAFAKKFPRTFAKISKEKLCKIDLNFFRNLPCIKAFAFENLKNFQGKKELSNTVKMFYGYSKILELLEKYEQESGVKYDFLIRIRPDLDYEFPTLKSICALKEKEVACDMGRSGLGDIGEIAHSKDLKPYLNTINLAKTRTSLSYFSEYPKAILNTPKTPFLSHYYLFFYFISLGLTPVNLGLKIQRNKALYENLALISCLKELKKDLKQLRKQGLSQTQSDEILAFFELITLYKQGHFVNAVFRVRNQLSYKLGFAMVKSSNFARIFLPLVLLKIVLNHKICEYKYKQILAKNPNLRLTPLQEYENYQEALKLKNHLSYKLGNAFLKACKELWGGGLIKFIFVDAAKICKEFKNKKH